MTELCFMFRVCHRVNDAMKYNYPVNLVLLMCS